MYAVQNESLGSGSGPHTQWIPLKKGLILNLPHFCFKWCFFANAANANGNSWQLRTKEAEEWDLKAKGGGARKV